ncbi:MAG: glycosyltransferase [Acidobacteriota bacterium]|nr:glycosyltransferase [Acidobacteriota bacterium]
MRILQIIRTLDPCYGGPAQGVRDSTRELARLGHAAEILTLDSPGSSWTSRVDVPVVAIGPSRTDYRYTPRLAPWLERHAAKYDAVIVNGIWDYAAVGSWRVLRNSATPYFVYTHGMLDPWFQKNCPLKHIKKTVYWKLWANRVLRDARATLFTCEEERRLAGTSFSPYRCTARVVSYGTAAPPNGEARQKQKFFERFPGLLNRRIILYLGRMHRIKGCDVLLRAFAQVAPRDPRLQLVLAGPDSELSGELRRLAGQLGVAERITWTGGIFDDLKWGALRSAELFALSSHSDSFGVSVIEAMACGVPVAISNKVNIWREIAKSGAGYVSSDDVAGTAGALEKWLTAGHPTRTAMRQNAARCFLERYEVRHSVGKLIRTLECCGVANTGLEKERAVAAG